MRKWQYSDIYHDTVIGACMEWFGTYNIQWAIETLERLNNGEMPQYLKTLTFIHTRPEPSVEISIPTPSMEIMV